MAALAGCAAGVDRGASSERYSFGLFSDLAYRAHEEAALEKVLEDLNAATLAFVVHLGDLGAPIRNSCTDALWALRRSQFEASVHPLIYTPGDNEWTDCHTAAGVAGGDPMERLASLRTFFFHGDSSFGRRSMALERQSRIDPAFPKYRENARWTRGGVTFITLHVVGSNNGIGVSAAGDAEHADRMRANIAWLRAGFVAAQAAASRAVVVLQQANMFPEIPPFSGKSGSGTVEMRAALERETIAFGRPVLLAHGDSHFFRVDKPLGRRFDVPAIENFTRVEGFGSPNHHWVEVMVDSSDPNVFSFRPRIVKANIVDRSGSAK